MSGKAANLNGVLENQGSDLHWQVAFSDTTDTIHAFTFKSLADQEGFAPSPQIPARSRIDFNTVSASKTSRAKA